MDLPSYSHDFNRHQDISDLLLMVMASLVFHVIIFSLLLLAPEPVSRVRVSDTVYQVSLVSAPVHHRTGRTAQHSRAYKKAIKRHRLAIKRPPVHRRAVSRKKSRPVIIAKKVVKLKRPAHKKPKISSSGLIDKAIGQLKQKVHAETKDHVEEAISRLARRVTKQEKQKGSLNGGQYAENSVSINIYRMEVETRIKENWVYPVGLINSRNKQGLEAVCVLKVKKDGSIVSFSFKKRSRSIMFDESVKKAIEKSNPLPPFPEGYHKTYDEIEITFNPKDMDI